MYKHFLIPAVAILFFVSTFSFLFPSLSRIEASSPIVHEQIATGTANNATTVSSSTVLGGTDQFYVAAVANYQNKAVNGVLGLGLTWTQVVNQCGARNATGTQLWYAKGSPTSSGQVTATFGATTQVAIISVSRYSGVDTVTSFVDAHGQNSLGENGPCSGGTDSRPAVITMTPTVADSLKVVAVNSRTRTITSIPASYTQKAFTQSGTSGALTGLGIYESPVSTVTSDTASFNLSGTTDWGVAGLILQPANVDPNPNPDPEPDPEPDPTPDPEPDPTAPVIVGAGNIAKCSWVTDEKTADLLDLIQGTVFTLGDHAYEDGTQWDFENCYEPSWGRHKDRTKPVVGNHDYQTPGASGYYNYFGAAAGDPTKGYYSYDVGEWHIVVLNSNCTEIGTCKKNSPQDLWLKADLAAHPTQCTLAMWHEASFSSSGGTSKMKYLWNTLYEYNADVILTAHQHLYERFAPQTSAGALDMARGLRQFVVGTGGAKLTTFDYLAPNSEIRDNQTHGVLKLTLHPTTYDWAFIPVAGQTFTDSGTGQCH